MLPFNEHSHRGLPTGSIEIVVRMKEWDIAVIVGIAVAVPLLLCCICVIACFITSTLCVCWRERRRRVVRARLVGGLETEANFQLRA
mmetsp:Transcript_10929/g.30282  ORF Transcript_10929/g.30282 Transcript_10929/m.30282 type:complete len:87 (+) Transcript_10929:125-385(+)